MTPATSTPTTPSLSALVDRGRGRLARLDRDKLVARARRELKHARLRIRPAEPARHQVLHIVGCQRSGTTMLTEIMDRDARVRVFGELETLFDTVPRHHRLLPDDEVRDRLAHSGAALNVVKPLVESHRVAELLTLGEGARALWMFRHYRDVASSNLRRFGIRNGIDNLRPIVHDDRDDWRNAGLTAETRELVRSHFDEDMAPHDAAALFWYCRNTLWFGQHLGELPDVRTCRYETLVDDPVDMLGHLYRWVGLTRPAASTAGAVHARSVGRGTEPIGDEITELCEEMWAALLDADRERSVRLVGDHRPEDPATR
jgi:hypothetical protein